MWTINQPDNTNDYIADARERHVAAQKALADERAAIEAEVARRNSPEAMQAALAEFIRRNPWYNSDPYTDSEMTKCLGNDEPTAENLEKAFEVRLAADMTQAQLKAYIESCERRGRR